MGNFNFKHDNEVADWNRSQIELLHLSHDLLNKYHISHWFGSGTLLGLYRDGCLINGDNDIDVYIKVEDINDNFFKMFDEIKNDKKFNKNANVEADRNYRNAYTQKKMRPANTYRMLYANLKTIGNKSYNVCCDVIILFPFKDFYFYKCLDNYCFRFKKDILEDFTYIEKYDRKIRIPAKTEDYLTNEYTEMWRERYDFNGWTHEYWHNWKNWQNELPENYFYTII